MPSKKVLSVLIVIMALVAAVMVAFGRDKSSEAINYASNLVAGEKIEIPENPNWQNELAVIPQNTNTAQAEEASAKEETITDTVSKTFMANYLALKQSGTLDQTSAQKLIDQTVNYVGESGGQTVKSAQLNVIADSGKVSMKYYGESLGNILKSNKPQTVKKEYEIVAQTLQSKDQSKINELDSIITVYNKIAGELTKMPVPKTFVKAHLDVTNKMAAMALALEETKTVLSDPIKGLLAIQSYQQNAAVFAKAIQAINTFLKINDIVYEQNTGGYYLLHGI